VEIDSPNTLVGGTTATARNVISGNRKDGLVLSGSSATGNVVQGNLIGTQADGTSPLGNKGNGVRITNSASNNTIGGAADGAGNTIVKNGTALDLKKHGIVVESGTGNAIRRNKIYNNTGRGIALGTGSWYDTLNHSGTATGPNNLQNTPVLTDISTLNTLITITGFLNSPTGTYTLEFFTNTNYNLSGFGDAETFLGDKTVTADDSGHADFTVIFPTKGSGKYIAATATDASGNTSGFSMVSTAGDGIADAGKVYGIGVTESGSLDLLLPDANPMHKDVYVEVDSMGGALRPRPGVLASVVAAFASAPANLVHNPDGRNGINLHADLDEDNLPFTPFPNGFADF
jgi:parallel beta-helix repeat protein